MAFSCFDHADISDTNYVLFLTFRILGEVSYHGLGFLVKVKGNNHVELDYCAVLATFMLTI